MTESTADPRARAAARRRRKSRQGRNADSPADTRVELPKERARASRNLGYPGAPVEQIAAALHMKKGNLYYSFKNKEEILFACHQYSLDRLLQLTDEVAASACAPA